MVVVAVEKTLTVGYNGLSQFINASGKETAFKFSQYFSFYKQALLENVVYKIQVCFKARARRHITWVFAIAGLDGRPIDCKSVINFCSDLMLIINMQMLSSTKLFQLAFVPAGRPPNALPSQILVS